MMKKMSDLLFILLTSIIYFMCVIIVVFGLLVLVRTGYCVFFIVGLLFTIFAVMSIWLVERIENEMFN